MQTTNLYQILILVDQDPSRLLSQCLQGLITTVTSLNRPQSQLQTDFATLG